MLKKNYLTTRNTQSDVHVTQLDSGTNLINGIEFLPDEVPMFDDKKGCISFIEVPTIYPAINNYIGSKMNFDEIHNYNALQEDYFDSSAQVLFSQRIVFLLNNLLEESKLLVNSVSKDVFGVEYDNAGYAYLSINYNSVIELLPQLIDPYFYNTIRNTGGIGANKENLELISMAYSSILLNSLHIHTADTKLYETTMDKVDLVMKLASVSLFDMIRNIINTDNISNLFDYYPSYHIPNTIDHSNITYKL